MYTTRRKGGVGGKEKGKLKLDPAGDRPHGVVCERRSPVIKRRANTNGMSAVQGRKERHGSMSDGKKQLAKGAASRRRKTDKETYRKGSE